MEAPEPRTFYRIVQSDPPTERDFLSHAEQGKPAGRKAQAEGLHTGVSVYDSLEHARDRAAYWQFRHGEYIAVLRVAQNPSITYKQTSNDPAHFTLWATADVLLACVESVHPAEEATA
ncbi:MAG TPA: hypothetical protein VKV26_25845 [Dehalococcoidia bacterium]|nr:hypothetical protein [Dehalococcoidia bacterium]